MAINAPREHDQLVLGLDLGTNSVGWAIVQEGSIGDAVNIVAMGARAFDESVEKLGQGDKEQTTNVARRQARLARRVLRRRAQRMKKLGRLLQRHALLPEGDATTARYWHALDATLRRAMPTERDRWRQDTLLPYVLRAHALDRKLSAYELGRAIYHLAQRRGFLSNRRAPALEMEVQIDRDAITGGEDRKLTDAELKQIAEKWSINPKRVTSLLKEAAKATEGAVKGGIHSLQAAIDAMPEGRRTLGAYLATLDPREQRIRARHTSRKQYEDEFEAIWTGQAKHDPALTDKLRREIHRCIFKQRPLKSMSATVGDCMYEPGQRRMALALPLAQRYRLLQKLNDIRVVVTDGPRESARALADDERTALHDALRDGDLSIAAAKKLLRLGKNARVNLAGEDGKIPGDRTGAKLRKVLGESWDALSDDQQVRIVGALLGIESDVGRAKIVASVLGCDHADERARKVAAITLEDGYLSLSRRAVQTLLPQLADGVAYMTAVKEAYPEHRVNITLPELPPVNSAQLVRMALSAATRDHSGKRSRGSSKKREIKINYGQPVKPDVLEAWKAGRNVLGALRNPIVARTLTEMRTIVNAIIKQHGKPDVIRVELGRDLKRNATQRQEISKRIKDNETARNAARERVINEAHIESPRPADILKLRLWEECAHTCPFTGKAIAIEDLFGAHPQFDIEHILPFSRTLDDSFVNKTLCDVDHNRNAKRDRLPREYLTDEQLAKVVARIEAWPAFKQPKSEDARTPREKLRRFQMTQEQFAEREKDFTARHLNDTRYASRLAGDYLALLYGGRSDPSPDGGKTAGKLRIQVGTGRVTKYVRDELDLNRILNDGRTDAEAEAGQPGKSRADHRHHAVDAIAIALTSPAVVKRLSDAASLDARLAARQRDKDNGGRGRLRRFAPTLREQMLESWPTYLTDIRHAIDNVVVSHRVRKRVSGKLHQETNYSPPRDRDGRRVADPGATDGQRRYTHLRVRLDAMSKSDVANIVDDTVRQLVQDKLEVLNQSDPAKAFNDPANLPVHKDGRTPIRKARVRGTESAVQIRAGDDSRWVVGGNNHHVEIVQDGERWEPRIVTMIEAMRRRAADPPEPVVKRDHGPDARFVFSLAERECIRITQGTDAIPNGIYIVRSPGSIGDDRVSFVGVRDARLKAEIQKDKAFHRKSPNELRKLGAEKVTVDPLGRVRIARD